MPETPIFLYKKHKEQDGDKVLSKIYKKKYIEAKKDEMKHEVQSVIIQTKEPFVS